MNAVPDSVFSNWLSLISLSNWTCGASSVRARPDARTMVPILAVERSTRPISQEKPQNIGEEGSNRRTEFSA